MILWFVDRFGLPGQYHRIWVRLLRDNYIPIQEVQVVSLHKLMAPKQLLTSYMTRKAPTWVPDLGPEITARINAIVAHLKPRAVVLAAPESLACLGLAPEHATLHSLRGSVYWRSGVPHLVMLPMSAWNSLVSQKEIGAANYGFENQETFTAARSHHGEIREEGIATGALHSDSHAGTRTSAANLGQRGRASEQSDSSHDVTHPRPSLVGGGVHPVSTRPDAESTSGSSRTAIDAEPVRDGHVPGEGGWSTGDSGTSEEWRDPDGTLSGDPDDDSGEAGATGSGDADDSGVDDNDDGVSSSDGGSDSSGDSDSSNGEDAEVDEFFYEPVLSPVGRFVLTADTQKLFRILRDGKHAAGPARPIEVEWHGRQSS